MKAVVVQSNRHLTIENVDKPALKNRDDVLVKVLFSGLCGSDIPRIFHHGTHFYPIVLGHEFSGVIEQCGEDVFGLGEGDLVSCAPLQPCFDCEECRKGFYSLCKNYNFIGSRRFGANAEYICVNQRNLVKMPPGSDALQSAFIEPITVGLHAIHLAKGCIDKNVIVIGAGTIGLLVAQCAKALGAATVTVIDINEEKLTLAKSLGADFTFNSAQCGINEIMKQLHEYRFDQLILETAGVPQTVALSVTISGPKAQIALVGTLHQDLHLDQTTFGLILRKELTVLGSWMNYSAPWPGAEWKEAVRLVAENQIKTDPLIASVHRINEYIKSVEALDGKPMNGKLVLKFD